MERILALDVGEKHMGVAVSDELGLTAQPITIISRNGLDKDLKEIEKLLREYSIAEIIVGIPFNMDGTAGKSAERVFSFINFLRKRLKIPVKTWDERLTTVSSEKILLEADLSRKKRKKVIDKVAASFLLQNYLDNRRE